MQYEATDVMGLVALVTWACLNIDGHVNPAFPQIFPSQERFSTVFLLAGFIFCHGLFDTVQSASPPSLSWFKSLSAVIPKKVWGIYVLVLKKQGFTPLLYIGSGTSVAHGVYGRLQGHRRRDVIPRYIAEAYRDGYEITHQTLLAYCPIPAPANIPLFRYLVVALEGAFCCIFWPMHRRDKSYGIGHMCLWPREAFEWGGLCSHSPLMEPVHGDLSLTPEQLESIDAATKERLRTYRRECGRKIAKNPEKKAHTEKVRQKRQSTITAQANARRQKIKSTKQFYCTTCDVAFSSAVEAGNHNDTPRHKKKVAHGAGPFPCVVCDVSFKWPSQLATHEKSKKHQKKVQAQS